MKGQVVVSSKLIYMSLFSKFISYYQSKLQNSLPSNRNCMKETDTALQPFKYFSGNSSHDYHNSLLFITCCMKATAIHSQVNPLEKNIWYRFIEIKAKKKTNWPKFHHFLYRHEPFQRILKMPATVMHIPEFNIHVSSTW